MSELPAEEEAPGRRRRRWPRVLAALAVLVLVVGGIAWLQRIRIAEGFLARELARRGVPARYVVKEIGFFTQRIERVSIGDPAGPDLTADWIEVQTGFTLAGPVVTGVRAGPLRMRGRLVGGKLSLGTLDRLMPPPSGKPFTLPKLYVDLQDARMALTTPQGDVALALRGSGQLDDGFSGRLGAASAVLSLGDCTLRGAGADARVRIAKARPSLDGSLRASAFDCDGLAVSGGTARFAVDLDAALSHWAGRTGLSVASLRTGAARLTGVEGATTFEGSAEATAGKLRMGARQVVAAQGSAERAAFAGTWSAGGRGMSFDGTVSSPRAALSAATSAAIARSGSGGQGTPVAPLMARLAGAAAAASRAMAGEVALSGRIDGGRGTLQVTRADLSSPTGAGIALRGGEGIRFAWPDGGVTVGGTLTTRGGGLPEAAIELSQAGPGAPISGVALIQPYAAGGAKLALTAVRFRAAPGGVTQVSTQATLSGPLSGGRVDDLVLPFDGRWDGRVLTLNPGCAPLAFQRLQVSSLVLNRTRLNLCPTRGALVTMGARGVTGGAKVGGFRLGGTIGSAPLGLVATGGSFDFGTQRFALTGVEARIGAETVTGLDVAQLDGRLTSGGAAGSFAGAGGQIGSVPLLLGGAAGQWDLAGGRLALEGGMKVSDAAAQARFHPQVSDNVRLTLANNRIDATGTLRTPGNGTGIADVTLTHDLANGRGSAVLDVQGINFAEAGLQPSDLTPLTFGVIAAVKGRISGQGRIAWSDAGVTSTGVFRTAGTDLAAAFGPVTGLSTEIRFDDLLNMHTETGQMGTVAVLNPGIPVENGTIHYQVLDSQRVKVEGGKWPFAGGLLELDPTVLDFSKDQERRMTFRLTGVDAAQFLQEMEFDNLNATGTFDGVLPIIFDARGGRIEGGHLKARAGGSIAYIGEVSQHDLGTWGNLAFQALKSLDYRDLALDMNGSLAGDMVTEIRFSGVSQGEGAKSNFLTRRLEKLPFVFNVTIRAPFRQLLESVQSWYDPSRLIQRNLPALIEEQERQQRELQQQRNIQPSESETVP